ncbi:MAG: antitoxin [Blautia sp.]|nr:antitoxin [Blautia sp.]
MVKMSFKDLDSELSKEELQELEEAAVRTIVFDDESPEMTADMLKQFKQMKQKDRTKQTASIRLSEKAQRFSKSYGKGYTSFLSRLIDAALDDAALVKKCL